MTRRNGAEGNRALGRGFYGDAVTAIIQRVGHLEDRGAGSPGTPLGGVARRLAFHLALLRSVASSCHLAQFELVPVAEDQLLLMPFRGVQVTRMRTYGLCQNGSVCDEMVCRRLCLRLDAPKRTPIHCGRGKKKSGRLVGGPLRHFRVLKSSWEKFVVSRT